MEKQQLLACLKENRIPNRHQSVGDEAEIIVSQRGGRIYGPFPKSEDGDGLFWIAPPMLNADRAKALCESNAWNTGGDRLWIGPEIRYGVTDRERFWETLHTSEAMDPGDYLLGEDGGFPCLTQTIRMDATGPEPGSARLEMGKCIYPAPNPLREMPDIYKQGISYCGFEQRIGINGSGSAVEPWSLLQVKPGGTILIPMYQATAGIDYYEPAVAFERLHSWGVSLKATGRNRYKVGYKAATVCGRLGYLCQWNGRPCLLVRSFPNDPSGLYAEEPPVLQNEKGFSVHVYNDGGPDGFAEIECSLPAVLGDTPYRGCDTTISTWIFCGNKAAIGRIMSVLLGVRDFN
jgi:hypothetical protein